MAKHRELLDLNRLRSGMAAGVTPAMGGMMAEAAAVVLESNGHHSGVEMAAHATTMRRFTVEWQPLHQDARRAHNDLPEAAHYAAYGIAFLLIESLTDFRVFERSYKGTGIDYWLARDDAYPFQRAAKLEVSGIIRDPSQLHARLRAKIKQVRRFRGGIPAYIVIVEFSTPRAILRKV